MVSDGSETELTVVVLTRARPVFVERALASLDAQVDSVLNVLLVVDDCESTWAAVSDLTFGGGAINRFEPIFASRVDGERSGPGRVAKLRDLGIQKVSTEFCAFLDDDNVLEPEHFASLMSVLRSHSSPAAHSWRSMWTEDGRPHYLTDRHPWARDELTARRIFGKYEAAGIYEVGSNVIRDQVVPFNRDDSMADTSEWLFRTAFLRSIPFCLDYDEVDWQTARTEDSKLLDVIVRSGAEIPCTRRATLRYFLGGYSNNANHEAAQIEGWKPLTELAPLDATRSA